MRWVIWLRAAVLVSAALLAGCDPHSVNPVTGKTIYPGVTPETEAMFGAKLNAEMVEGYGVYRQAGLNDYVSRVGQALAQHAVRPGVHYSFTILDDEEINAFALPGGYVYVTRGALAFANNEAELAAILGHEIGHVDAFHFRHRDHDSVSGVLSVLLKHASKNAEDQRIAAQLADKAAKSTGYSQDQEFEADALGIHYMTLAGYDPEGMLGMLEAERAKSALDDGGMKGNPVAHDIFALDESHPATPARQARALEAVKKAVPPPGVSPKTERDAYLAAIDQLSFGADPDEGMVEGPRLRNPIQGFSFEAPQGFDLWTDRTGAFGVGPNAAMILEAAQPKETPSAGQSMVAYVQTAMADDMPVANVRPLEIPGYRAATGTVDMDVFKLRVAAVRGIDSGAPLYKLMFVTPRGTFNEADAGFLEALKSFRPLKGAEARPPRVPSIKVVTVAAGDSAKSLAERMAVPDQKLEWFRVLNGLGPGAELKPGDKVKLVE
jgi:predicted Zn-dependent protease